MHVWYEVTKLNANQDSLEVLYSLETISDYITGFMNINLLTGNAKINYKRDDIDINDVYNLSENLASHNAEYILDYMLNNFISEKFNFIKRTNYFHYNNSKNRIVGNCNDKFININPSN